MFQIRRCLGLMMLATLTAVLGLGVARAQTGGGIQPRPQKDIPPMPDESGTVPLGQVKKQEEQPKYAFQFAAAPWAQVFEWLRDITGMPVSTDYRPTASLTFVPPKDKTGKPLYYTVPEIIDILNEQLLVQKYIIIRRERTLMVWPADEKLPPEVVRSSPKMSCLTPTSAKPTWCGSICSSLTSRPIPLLRGSRR